RNRVLDLDSIPVERQRHVLQCGPDERRLEDRTDRPRLRFLAAKVAVPAVDLQRDAVTPSADVVVWIGRKLRRLVADQGFTKRLSGLPIRVVRMIARDLAGIRPAVVRAAQCHGLAARLEKELVDVRRAVRELIPAPESNQLGRTPTEQGFVRRHVSARIPVVRVAIAELEIELASE